MYEVETRKYEPKNFFAGEFPTLTETGTAGEALEEHVPVAKNADGKVVAVSVPAEGKEIEVVGITAAAVEADDPVVYYITGEYFTDAIILPEGVDAGTLKDALKKISIFLK